MESVINAAIEWWESNRPVNWSLKQHLEHPRVNCSTKAEQELATAIAISLNDKEILHELS